MTGRQTTPEEENRPQPEGENRPQDDTRAVQRPTSRRHFLRGSAALGATATLANVGRGQDTTTRQQGASDDSDVLRTLLDLEQLQVAVYEDLFDEYDDEETLRDTFFAEQLGNSVRNRLDSNFLSLRQQERNHASRIESELSSRGVEPTPANGFQIDDDTLDEFVGTLGEIERTAVEAYAEAIRALEDPELVALAVSIHSVEARHAAYLRTIDASKPFPGSFDEPQPLDEVREFISRFE